MEKNEQALSEKTKSLSEKNVLKFLAIACVIVYACVVIIAAAVIKIAYAEIDSYVLPVISIQYRGSLTMNADDLKQAQIDLPELYSGIETYEDLRSAKLVRATDAPDTWLSHYFPIYSIVSLPAKLLFQLLGLPQSRAFSFTNAALLIAAMVVVLLCLKTSELKKLTLLLCLGFSPAALYTTYISAEAMLFSFVTIALVMYHEKRYRTAAVFVTLAGWANPTIMMLGIVMIINYLTDIIIKDRKAGVKVFLKNNTVGVLTLALCYVWSFVPFIFNAKYINNVNSTFGAASTEGWGGRIWAYFFDINLGFCTFALIPIVLSIITIPALIARKKYSCFWYYAALIGTVCAFALMKHINCGMVFCARYVVWSYPMLAFITALFALDVFEDADTKRAASVITSLSLILLIVFNLGTNCLNINAMTKLVWNNFPSLYSPLPSTYHARMLHIDGGYGLDDIVEYCDERSGYVRKIILLGNEESKAEVLSRYVCVKGEESEFIKTVEQIPNDGDYHYINIGLVSTFQITKVQEAV